MAGRSSFFLVAAALWVGLVCSAQPRTMSEATARKLVREALAAQGESGPSVQIGPWKYDWAPEFYTFSAWRHNLADGLLVTYYFAVNPWTGDVWDAIGCSRIKSPGLDREQESILKRSHLSADKRKALSEKSPGCSVSETGP